MAKFIQHYHDGRPSVEVSYNATDARAEVSVLSQNKARSESIHHCSCCSSKCSVMPPSALTGIRSRHERLRIRSTHNLCPACVERFRKETNDFQKLSRVWKWLKANSKSKAHRVGKRLSNGQRPDTRATSKSINAWRRKHDLQRDAKDLDSPGALRRIVDAPFNPASGLSTEPAAMQATTRPTRANPSSQA